jgi:hypothetical protein
MVIFSFVRISYTKINKAKSKKVMRLAENESRQIGLKFEALVELMKLKYYKRSEVIFAG